MAQASRVTLSPGYLDPRAPDARCERRSYAPRLDFTGLPGALRSRL